MRVCFNQTQNKIYKGKMCAGGQIQKNILYMKKDDILPQHNATRYIYETYYVVGITCLIYKV